MIDSMLLKTTLVVQIALFGGAVSNSLVADTKDCETTTTGGSAADFPRDLASALDELHSSPPHIERNLDIIERALIANESMPTIELQHGLRYLRTATYAPEMKLRLLKLVDRISLQTKDDSHIQAVNNYIKLDWLAKTNPRDLKSGLLLQAWLIITSRPAIVKPQIVIQWQEQFQATIELLDAKQIVVLLHGYLNLSLWPPAFFNKLILNRLDALLRSNENIALQTRIDVLTHLCNLAIPIDDRFYETWLANLHTRIDEFTTEDLLLSFYSLALANRQPPDWLTDATLDLLENFNRLSQQDIDRIFLGVINFNLQRHPKFAKFPHLDYQQIKSEDSVGEAFGVKREVIRALAKEIKRQVNTDSFIPELGRSFDIVEGNLIVEIVGPEAFLFRENERPKLKPRYTLYGRVIKSRGMMHTRINWRRWQAESEYRKFIITDIADIILKRPQRWRRTQ